MPAATSKPPLLRSGDAELAPDRTGAGPDDHFVLADLLSHLLRRGHFEAEALFSSSYEGLDVTSRQLALIFTINANPGASQAQIADQIGLDANTFSDLARRSEHKGLIKRQRLIHDRRTFGLFLTEDGKAMVARTRPLTEPYQQRISARLSTAERRHLVVLLQTMLGLQPQEKA
jgi:DNA-binding MarR family transcriptional regulator